MKVFVFLFLLTVVNVNVEGVINWLNHELYSCVQCLCHARSGCWLRQNCAKYSISENYWRKAGELTVSPDEDTDLNAYRRCMADENCIVGTIIQYTKSFGNKDCNCDGEFNCKDLAAMHLKGGDCQRPEYGQVYARRFNHCATKIGVKHMLPLEGEPNCMAPEVMVN